jgi:hypothetical protein
MKLTRTADYIDSLIFHTPPEEKGQMVQYAFAQGDGETLLKIVDYSKPKISYKVVEVTNEFEPWNQCPSFQAVYEEPLKIV